MIGQNIGKYRVLDRIGRGGMGTVYRAIDETLDREVAIKVLNAELNDPQIARRFRAEAVTVARLSHPGIATVFELLQHDGQWWMVMEFVRGETLEALVTRSGALSVETAAGIGMQVLNALAHAHSLGIVHRDLKPANLMQTDSGAVKIMDFGIARVAGTEHLTNAGLLMGTPAYMAPEQVTAGEVDARTDLYAMGVVFYHLVTGKLPFKGDTPFVMAQARMNDLPMPVRAVRENLPEWVDQIIDIALARDPARRFQSAARFHEALRRGLANLPLGTVVPQEVPPELVATVLPGTLPVVAPPMPPAPQAARQTTRDEEVPPTVATLRPMPAPVTPPPAAAPPSGAPPAAPRVQTPAPDLAALDEVVAGIVTVRTEIPGAGPSSIVASLPPPSTSLESTATFPIVSSGTTSRAGTAARLILAWSVAIVVVAGLGGWIWTRSRLAAGAQVSRTPGTAGPTGTPAGAPGNGSPPSGQAESGAPPPSTPLLSSATGTSAPGSNDAAALDGSTRARGANGPALATAAPGRRGSGPDIADPPLAFDQMKYVVVTGKKTEERDGSLRFGAGQIQLVAKGGGAAGAIPYRDLMRATYARAKDPKWDVTLAAPTADADFPGWVIRSTRHWLVLQSRTAFLIVRMTDGDWEAVVETVTARTGVDVQRASGGL